MAEEKRIENIGRRNLKDKYFFSPSPKYTPNTPSNTDDTLILELTNTLLLTSEKETGRRRKANQGRRQGH